MKYKTSIFNTNLALFWLTGLVLIWYLALVMKKTTPKQDAKTATAANAQDMVTFHVKLESIVNEKLEADAKRLRRSRRSHVAHLLTQFYMHPHIYAENEK